MVNRLTEKAQTKDDYKKLLAQKIDKIAKEQEDLLETTNTAKVSTFIMMDDGLGVSMDSGSKIKDNVRKIMKKGGITDTPINQFIQICIIAGCVFTFALIYFDFLECFMGTVIGMFLGAFVVYNVYSFISNKKKMDFLKLFPDAIDMMIRGVKAGLSIERVLKLVSMESKEPLSKEFNTITQKFALGIEPEKVLVDAADKVDIEEFRFLVVALVLQMENGGVLVEILQNLAGMIRQRLELELKVKVLSAEARMSAVILSILPFIFLGIMAVVNPSHLKGFTTPGAGQTMLKIAITLFCIGTFLMIKATQIKV
ncbi:MAG: type II secretion system F family protein [Holosporaceae bacterium]|nr:type II secretion system F family protein [Holosporaceae bacterium]